MTTRLRLEIQYSKLTRSRKSILGAETAYAKALGQSRACSIAGTESCSSWLRGEERRELKWVKLCSSEACGTLGGTNAYVFIRASTLHPTDTNSHRPHVFSQVGFISPPDRFISPPDLTPSPAKTPSPSVLPLLSPHLHPSSPSPLFPLPPPSHFTHTPHLNKEERTSTARSLSTAGRADTTAQDPGSQEVSLASTSSLEASFKEWPQSPSCFLIPPLLRWMHPACRPLPAGLWLPRVVKLRSGFRQTPPIPKTTSLRGGGRGQGRGWNSPDFLPASKGPPERWLYKLSL